MLKNYDISKGMKCIFTYEFSCNNYYFTFVKRFFNDTLLMVLMVRFLEFKLICAVTKIYINIVELFISIFRHYANVKALEKFRTWGRSKICVILYAFT